MVRLAVTPLLFHIAVVQATSTATPEPIWLKQ